MTVQRILVGLTALNLVLLVLLAAWLAPVRAAAPASAGTLRGNALEIVDQRGRVRASIAILPASAGGSETVILRLINADGQPSVKIATSATTGGLSLVGGDDASYVILQADGPETTLKMVEPNGRQQVISP